MEEVGAVDAILPVVAQQGDVAETRMTSQPDLFKH